LVTQIGDKAGLRQPWEQVERMLPQPADRRRVEVVGVFVRDVDICRAGEPVELGFVRVVLQPPAAPIDRTDQPRVSQQQRRFAVAIERDRGMAKGFQNKG